MIQFQLRDYQEQARTDTFTAWETYQSVLGCLPTGAGKTVVAGAVIRERPGRTLVLCHTGELVSQFSRSLWRVGIDSQIEKADLWAEKSLLNDAPVVIATPQTLYARSNKRLQRWSPDDFSTLIIDEAHLYSGPKAFEGVVKHFQKNPELRCLCLTATPNRSDGIALARICNETAFNYEILYMIENGWLVEVDARSVRIESLDLSKCRTEGGDFARTDLAAIVEQEKPLLGMADATLKTVGTRKTLVFAHSVKQAENLAEIFNRYRPDSAGCVFGHTPEEKRLDVFRRFADQRLQIMVNVGVAGIGYDNPLIQAIAMCKPTKSQTLYRQQAGRGLRPLPGIVDEMPTPEERRFAIKMSGKPSVLILDFVGNHGRHSLCSAVDLLGGHISVQAKERVRKQIEKTGRENIFDALTLAEKELLEAEERRKRSGIVASARFKLSYVDPFDSFRSSARFWSGYKQTRPLTLKQRKLVRDAGFNPDEITPQEGADVIANRFAIRPKQQEVLIRAGYSAEELRGIKVWQASQMITRIKENGWKRPRP